MNPNAVIVAASSYQQACAAAGKAGLSRVSLPRGNWFYASDAMQVSSSLPERVIFARPVLWREVDMTPQLELERVLRYRCMRSRIEPEIVWV